MCVHICVCVCVCVCGGGGGGGGGGGRLVTIAILEGIVSTLFSTLAHAT